MSRTVIDEGEPFSMQAERADLSGLASILGIGSFKGDGYLSELPFMNGDVTAGSESEYQTAVFGDKNDADLPSAIKSSKYYSNIMRRIQAGEIAKSNEHLLNRFINDNRDEVWENSWVRFPCTRLKRSTWDPFLRDLLADKDKPDGPKRRDYYRFFWEKDGVHWIRIPMSYLLKLALADALTFAEHDEIYRAVRTSLAEHFLNDNSSPETYSFFPVRPEGFDTTGRKLAKETLLRFLLAQFALMYAYRAFGLAESGQKPLLYFAPQVPLRMRNLNNIVSDSFFRELFMSPCLSGWSRGYDKHEYMHLCHQVLSRSHLNSVFRLKEAGILDDPLIRLDSISNTSLANNGTHVSLGSRRLSALAAAGEYPAAAEKAAGDLVIKIVEHFLPLFPDLYGASPWRIAYRDFRPENVAGFLAHELTNTHLRMLWRRWAKKAGIEFFGKAHPANGSAWYEDMRGAALRLKGDFIPDMRLADYFVALPSTPESPALSGVLGNDRALKADLASQGVFDERMSVYLPVKLREFGKMRFTGFEARHYSIFESLLIDMTEAVDLQQAITAFACKAVIEGRIGHEDIPDDQFTESERRQIFFSSALGVETVNIRETNPNRVMEEILSLSPAAGLSGRYDGFRKIKVKEYRLALIELLRKDVALLKALGAEDLLSRCEDRIRSGDSSGARLTAGIMGGSKKGPLSLRAEDFNERAERYYREDLRKKNLKEALDVLRYELASFRPAEDLSAPFGKLFSGMDPAAYVESNRKRIVAEDLDMGEIVSLLAATSILLYQGKREASVP